MGAAELAGLAIGLASRNQRQMERNRRTIALVVLRLDPAAMRFDDGTADRQAHTHAIFLGGEESLKQAADVRRRETRSGIGNLQRHADALVAPAHERFNTQPPLLAMRFGHGLDTV